MSSNVLSLMGWSFLPNLATSWVQTIWYGITIRAGDPKPQPGTPRHAEHRRIIHILVVSLYLAYTIYEANFELRREGTFYTDLGVPQTATDREIKSRYRRLAALHHPDKAAPGDDAVSYFMHLKLASETLQDAARRFAYDRYGPDVVAWQKCVTVRDYVSRGIFQVTLPHYGAAAAVMYVLAMFGYLEWGKYWRWLFLVGLCVFETYAITRPHMPSVVGKVINPIVTTLTPQPAYVQFQIISLLRKLSITVYIAFSQIGPLLNRQGQQERKEAESSEASVQQGLERLEAMTQSLNGESARLLEMELSPFAGDPGVVEGLRGKIKDWLVQNTIRSDPMVRDALGNSFRRRRTDAPAGAKGNR